VKIATQVGLSVVALGVIGAAAYLGTVAAISRAVAALERLSKIGNSPIMASGGSMTFRAAGSSWTCDTPAGSLHTWCMTQDTVYMSTVAWDNLVPQGAPGTLGWTKLTKPWKIDILARPDGNTGGVKMCTTGTAPSTATPPKAPTCDVDSSPSVTSYTNNLSYIVLLIEGSSQKGGTLNLYDSVYDSAKLQAVQYYDSGCSIHNAANQTPKMVAVPPCEHPGQVTASFDTATYKCQHGICQIGIDQ
jgi:hypothetical protein